jgi:DNA replication protein DnaC
MAGNPDCLECDGTGWKQVTRDGVAAVERCGCVETQRKDTLVERASVPARFQEASFENFRLPRENPIAYESLGMAMNDARVFAREYPFTPKPGLMFQGNPGVGKTHLAAAVMNELVNRGFECVFFDYQNLLDRIRAGYNAAAGASDKAAYQIALDTEVLLLDDLGSHRVTEWVEDTVTAIINHRYNAKKAIIVTTNLPDENLGDRRADKNPVSGQYHIKDTLADRVGPRVRSRLFEMCRVVRMETRDFRLKDLAR